MLTGPNGRRYSRDSMLTRAAPTKKGGPLLPLDIQRRQDYECRQNPQRSRIDCRRHIRAWHRYSLTEREARRIHSTDMVLDFYPQCSRHDLCGDYDDTGKPRRQGLCREDWAMSRTWPMAGGSPR